MSHTALCFSYVQQIAECGMSAIAMSSPAAAWRRCHGSRSELLEKGLSAHSRFLRRRDPNANMVRNFRDLEIQERATSLLQTDEFTHAIMRASVVVQLQGQTTLGVVRSASRLSAAMAAKRAAASEPDSVQAMGLSVMVALSHPGADTRTKIA